MNIWFLYNISVQQAWFLFYVYRRKNNKNKHPTKVAASRRQIQYFEPKSVRCLSAPSAVFRLSPKQFSWVLARTSCYMWEQSLKAQMQVAKILLLSLITQRGSPHTACNTSQCEKSTLHSQEKVFLVSCDFKSFSERNIHLFKYLYRCIKPVWKETLFLEEMKAIQIRPLSLRKAARDPVLSSVPIIIY